MSHPDPSRDYGENEIGGGARNRAIHAKKEGKKKPFDQHAQMKKNNALMLKIDRKREKDRIANELKNKTS